MIYHVTTDVEGLISSKLKVLKAYPHLVKIVDEANKLLPKPYFHFDAWVNNGVTYVKLLYGDYETQADLQELDYSLSQIQCAVQGFINGFELGKQSMKGQS